MPPPSSKPPPLPLAPDRAAISNKISLLLSNRTSLLKTLNPPSSSLAQQTTRRHKVNADDIEQLFSGPRPNEGVGYVPDRKAAAAGDAAAREDRMLRGRLLGKKGQMNGKGGGKKVAAVESESDEEPGRSGLGKRKRKRREVEEEVEEDGDKVGEDEVEDKETGHVEDAAPVLQQEETITDSNGGDDAKRNKKKKKRQREKEKQKQKKLSNTSS
ncbi:hypothetical protein TsFJ059_001172 [Trichoderma semiorbis]|uniref:Uncharacterized protein n=1 Tax=Trichoderma semiorbis TaxID=1491008 RepID=A0A9P8I2V6_9HYPO|nr:hypothetical protein TsFJ059_001172 [Trichoderma semiorbis]